MQEIVKHERSERVANPCVYPYLNTRTAKTVIQLFYSSGIFLPNFSFSKPFESLQTCIQSLDKHVILLNELKTGMHVLHALKFFALYRRFLERKPTTNAFLRTTTAVTIFKSGVKVRLVVSPKYKS